MTVSEVVNKLAMEQALALGDLDSLPTCRRYIQMALSIGIEHFAKHMDEIIVMTRSGEEVGRYKSVSDCAVQIGIPKSYISAVLNGRRHSAGGFIFMKSKDKELVKTKKAA